MDRTALATLCAVLVTTSACRETAVEPGPRVVVLAPTVRLTALGAEFDPAARVVGAADQTVTARVRLSEPWLAGSAVVDETALAQGRLTARGPGHALVDFESVGATTATIDVLVELPSPTVLQIEGGNEVVEGAEVRLRGYRMNALPPTITVGGAPTALVALDSATAQFIVPSLSGAPPATTCGVAIALPFSIVGAVAVESAVLSRPAPKLSLDVGEWRTISNAEVGCLRFGPGVARYVLGWIDPTSLIDSGATAPIGFQRVIAPYTISGTDRSPVPAALRSTPTGDVQAVRKLSRQTAIQAAPQVEVRYVTPSPPSGPLLGPSLIDRPTWTVGDTLTVFSDQLSAVAILARVYAVYGNVPILAPDAAGAAFESRLRAHMDVVGPVLAGDFLPLLRRAIVDSALGTTRGDLPVLITSLVAFEGSSSGITLSLSPTDHIEISASLGTSFPSPSNAELLLRLLARGAAGLWINRFHGWERQIPRPVTEQRLQEWSFEGVNNLLAFEASRRALGVAIDGNYDFWNQAALVPFWNFPLAELLGGGILSAAVAHGNVTYFRSIVSELMVEHGLSYEAALRAVVEGAPFGLFGCYQSGCRPAGGLVAVMRRYAPAWDPAHSLIRFVMAQAMDDLTTNPELQNRTLSRSGFGWPLTFAIEAGSGTNVSLADAAAGTGGFAILTSAAAGGAFEVGSTVPLIYAIGRLP